VGLGLARDLYVSIALLEQSDVVLFHNVTVTIKRITD
jgi:hypothetical protein